MKFNLGDEVWIDCMTSMGAPLTMGKIEEIKTKYNEDTGKSYKIVRVKKGWFSMKTGEAVTPPTMYYIEPISD